MVQFSCRRVRLEAIGHVQHLITALSCMKLLHEPHEFVTAKEGGKTNGLPLVEIGRRAMRE